MHILDSLNGGGAEMLVLDVCRNAEKNGLEVSFAATGGGSLEEDFRASGVPFFRLQRRLPLDPSLVLKLRKIIRAQNIKIVHAHQAVEGLHAFFAARGTGAKLVLTFHGYIPDRKNRRVLRFLIPRMSANIAVSSEFLRRLGAEENFDTTRGFHVVYNGVDEKRLIPSGKDFRAETGVPRGALLFGMIGNFYATPTKDHLTACRALPEFFRRVSGAHFVFVGGTQANSDFEKCVRFCRENKIAERVHFTGARRDVADILDALDAFVLSTRSESFGIAAVEAMLARVPAALSGIAPLLEISGDGEFAEIFETGNAANLAEKLVKIGENKGFRRDLADRAYLYARENFSIEVHLENLKKLYETII
ncbi:MAG TPA: glycosyltransferase family 4 protein [Pyrinomonadaceae bacterium]